MLFLCTPMRLWIKLHIYYEARPIILQMSWSILHLDLWKASNTPGIESFLEFFSLVFHLLIMVFPPFLSSHIQWMAGPMNWFPSCIKTFRPFFLLHPIYSQNLQVFKLNCCYVLLILSPHWISPLDLFETGDLLGGYSTEENDYSFIVY